MRADLSPEALAKGEAISYYHTDHLGSSSIVTNSSGEVIRRTEYKPFGEIFLNLETNPGSDIPNFFYTGKRLDKDTGLYYYGARYYDPTIGRFTQADTIVPQPSNPQSFNRYSYTDNNPINYTDPTGHKKWFREWGGKIVGAIVGVITFAMTGNFGLAMAAYGFVSGSIDTYNAGYSVGQSLGIGIAVGTASYLGGQIGGAFGNWVGGANASAAALGSAIFGGAAAGAAGGATGAALMGGDVGQAAAQGAVIGGITGLFMHGLTYRGPPEQQTQETIKQATNNGDLQQANDIAAGLGPEGTLSAGNEIAQSALRPQSPVKWVGEGPLDVNVGSWEFQGTIPPQEFHRIAPTGGMRTIVVLNRATTNSQYGHWEIAGRKIFSSYTRTWTNRELGYAVGRIVPNGPTHENYIYTEGSVRRSIPALFRD